MATSSITANFACNDSKAANTFVELMFSPNVDSSWIAPDNPNIRIAKYADKAQERDFWLKVAERTKRQRQKCIISVFETMKSPSPVGRA